MGIKGRINVGLVLIRIRSVFGIPYRGFESHQTARLVRSFEAKTGEECRRG
jgi:hypothetical protein